MMLNTVLLQAAAAPEAPGYMNIAIILAIGVVFYFFMIRPQQKKQKEQKQFIEDIKKGDQIVSIGGIHGKVVEVLDGKVVVDIDRGTKITFEKSSISGEGSQVLEQK